MYKTLGRPRVLPGNLCHWPLLVMSGSISLGEWAHPSPHTGHMFSEHCRSVRCPSSQCNSLCESRREVCQTGLQHQQVLVYLALDGTDASVAESSSCLVRPATHLPPLAVPVCTHTCTHTPIAGTRPACAFNRSTVLRRQQILLWLFQLLADSTRCNFMTIISRLNHLIKSWLFQLCFIWLGHI